MESNKVVYSNCYLCGNELVEGQEIIMVHQYFYCNRKCLDRDISIATLGAKNAL